MFFTEQKSYIQIFAEGNQTIKIKEKKRNAGI